MALDHSRLGLENKSGRIFCVRQVYFTKSCQQIWRCVNQPFILFIHHIWGETVLWGAVFIIQTSDRLQYFTIFAIQISLIKYSGRWKHAWAFSEIVKKNSKSPIRPAGSHFWQPPNEWTITELHFNIIKNLLCLFFIWWFYKRSVIFKSVWYGRHFKYSCKRCSWTTENKRHKD